MAIDWQATGQPVASDALSPANLADHPLFTGFSAGDIATFLDFAQVRTFPAGAILHPNGGSGFTFVLAGEGHLHRGTGPWMPFGPGDHLGTPGGLDDLEDG